MAFAAWSVIWESGVARYVQKNKQPSFEYKALKINYLFHKNKPSPVVCDSMDVWFMV